MIAVGVHSAGEVPARDARGHAFEAVHQLGDGGLRRVVHEQVHVVGLAVELFPLCLEVSRTFRMASL
jgi:hypothetical protein